ncbi:MAG TPA: MBOAT family O-acyltransferase [Oscillospiraceae bacterium]|nr:MBOAT family O-acyltransferase [Oscillospiraceae bacterium]
MVFSSVTFLFFYLPIMLFIYYISPYKWKNFILFITGLFFYAWGEPIYITMMLLSTLIDYICGRLMELSKTQRGRKICLLASVLMNLSLLSVFKYSSFFITSINAVFGTSIPDPKLPLPIGISFFTFQSMSYTIDLYWRNVKVQRSFINFSSYVSMFPQIVAGPIVRYGDVAKELESRTITVNMVGEGVGIFIRGLAKKVLLANSIGMLWSQIKAMPIGELPAATAWIGILAFAFQIYFDFSGYSDMAVGLGKMLGFKFPQNFDHPYISKSISEFWRRWHMTLGGWFREYLYIPLGGNRNGTFQTVRNLLIVWFLTGLWHGASWNFVLWGVYFGVIIIAERFFLKKLLEKLPGFVQIMYTFLLVLFGWVIFEAPDVVGAMDYFGAMFGGSGKLFDANTIYMLGGYGLIFIVCIFASTEWFRKIHAWLLGKLPNSLPYAEPVLQLIIMLVCTAYLVDSTYNPFLYFRF